ncbi:MAG: metalloregulator ArsR/SmtB family transcription factor [Azospirillum sp.]|nr:metalloregulator ArsR/SmtB family transcription factor [Azospirillum sp.]
MRNETIQMLGEIDQAADQACELLKALASPTRLKILCHLVDGEKSVGQIAEAIGARDAAVSQHLALLRKDRIVRARRAGQSIFYAIENPAAERLLQILHDIFCGHVAESDLANLNERHP